MCVTWTVPWRKGLASGASQTWNTYHQHNILTTDHWPAAGALAPDGHPVPVSPQLEDVLLDPVQRQTLVPQPLTIMKVWCLDDCEWMSPDCRTPAPCPGWAGPGAPVCSWQSQWWGHNLSRTGARTCHLGWWDIISWWHWIHTLASRQPSTMKPDKNGKQLTWFRIFQRTNCSYLYQSSQNPKC